MKLHPFIIKNLKDSSTNHVGYKFDTFTNYSSLNKSHSGIQYEIFYRHSQPRSDKRSK
jgi:hypothetical protein